MLYEKKKLIIHRMIWALALLLGIIIPLVLALVPQKRLELIDENGSVNHYSESLNETNCEIEVKFNTAVDLGYITVAFYDSDDQLLSERRCYFYDNQTTVSLSFVVEGKVDHYKISDYGIVERDDNSDIAIYALTFVDAGILTFFITSLFLSYKAYEYNGNQIVVYCGWYHHYIKVNGIITDARNTLGNYTAVPLSCTLDDGTKIQAKISKMNRIMLKIDGKVYRKKK